MVGNDGLVGPAALVVMGVCGCGKSTIAQRLADDLGLPMLDADDFHPPANVDKMRSGIPLEDADRAGWLAALNRELRRRIEGGTSVVLACSALKQRYRNALQEGLSACEWVYLKGSRELIVSRMAGRTDHFMPTALIDSQLEALEEPTDAVVVDIEQTPEAIATQLAERFAALRR